MTHAEDRKILDSDEYLMAAITSMEVRRWVIVVEHRNHDSEEAAYLRHLPQLRTAS